MNWFGVEELGLWLVVGALSTGFTAVLLGVVFGRTRPLPVATAAAFLALGFLTATIGVRWIATGHSPVMGAYENALAGSWFVLALFLLLRRWYPQVVSLGVAILPFVLLMLYRGITTDRMHRPLEPAYQSHWLAVHVIFAWLAYSAFALAAAGGILYLLQGRTRHPRIQAILDRLPEPQVLDDLILRTILFGFIADAVMIGAGALWARGLWGRYWSWDPMETWSLLTWLIYGLNLHLRLTLGWKEKRAAWLAVFSFAGVLITFFGIGFISDISTRHTQLLDKTLTPAPAASPAPPPP